MARPSAFRKFLGAVVAPAVALALVALLAWSDVLDRLDRAWFDALQRQLAMRAPVPDDTAFVLIDEQSLRAMGADPYTMRWPWPRGAFAGLFAGLHRAGAKRVIGDFIFFEQSDAAEQDALLGAVAAGATEVTLGAMRDKKSGAEMLPVFWPADFRREHAALFDNQARWGLVNSLRDEDGVIRRYALGGSLVEVALHRPATPGAIGPTLLRWRGNLETLRARGVAIVPAAPFVAAGLAMIDHASEKVPDLDPEKLVRAIDDEDPPSGDVFAAVRGKTVFVGVNAAGTFDAVATPCGAPEPGVITHWTAYASIVSGDFLTDPGWRVSAGGLLLAVMVIGFSGRRGIGLSGPAMATAVIIVIAAAGSAAAFDSGLWFAPAYSVVGAAVTFSAVAVQSFQLERGRKREIQGWFGSYVSPAVVKRLVQNPDSLALGGERRELTVYFSDLAGFTTLSEKMPPDQLVRLVNVFLEELSECVLDEGCYLDKYIGDAIMAVFGSPEELENHALAACRAALKSQARLAILNDRIEREHGLRLGMRVGINTGDMIVGNVGSTKKRNYTVLGDAVNLASRLEGANKEFGTAILIGPLTRERAGDAIVTRPVARLRVKGKEQAVDVFELVAEASALDDATRQFVASFVEGYEAFQVRRFGRAVRAFEEAVDLRKNDALSARYLAESRKHSVTPPPADWEPVLTLESK